MPSGNRVHKNPLWDWRKQLYELLYWRRKMKKVKIGLELSNSFVSLLRNSMTIKGAIPPNETHELSVLEVLGLVVLSESMGAFPEDIWSRIPLK